MGISENKPVSSADYSGVRQPTEDRESEDEQIQIFSELTELVNLPTSSQDCL